MSKKQRIAVWFATGLENALAARAALAGFQIEHPGADWVLLGPRESLFLFEMDSRISAYIALRALEPRRPAQSRLSFFLEKRAQYKKLQGLQLDLCLGVSVTPAEKPFQHLLRLLKVPGCIVCKELPLFLVGPRPELQAGPQALAQATHHYRLVPPNALKALFVLAEEPGQVLGLEAQWHSAQNTLAREGVAHATTTVVCGKGKLQARQLAKAHPGWLQLELPQVMGFLAYADRVITFSPCVTQICSEMGRAERLLLGKKDS